MKQLAEKIKTQVFKFLNKEIHAKEMEKWVYQTQELETILDTDDYLTLISLDFSSPHAPYDIQTILQKNISCGEYETWKVKNLLGNILGKKESLPDTLVNIYTLYRQGFYFLDNLAIGFGLEIQSILDTGTPKSSIQVKQFINSSLSDIEHEAKRVLSWIEDNKIIIRDDYDVLGDIQFIDKRTALEKEPTTYAKLNT